MSDILEKIRTAVTTGGIQKNELATEAGVHRNSLKGIDDEDWNPRYQTLIALSNAVDAIKVRRA